MAKSKKSVRRKMVQPVAPVAPAVGGVANQSLLLDIHYAALADRVIAFYRRYQTWLWSGVAVVFLVTSVMVGWNFYQRRQAENISKAFYNLATGPEANRPAPWVDFATQYSNGAGAGYGALAAGRALQLLATDNNKDVALEKKLESAIKQNVYMGDLIKLRQGDAKGYEKTLRANTVTQQNGASGNPMVALALALADRLTADNKTAEAKKLLQAIALGNQNNLFGLLALQLLIKY